jgi:hypothetical protein
LGLRAFANKGIISGATLPAWVRFTGYPAQVARTTRLVVANLLTQSDRPRYLRAPIHPGPLKLFELDPTSVSNPNVRPPEEIERSAISSARTVAKSLTWISPEVGSNIEIQDPKMLLENLNGACQAADTDQTRRDVLLLALALQLHYREHGKFPASLDELVKQGYLKSIPFDPFGKGEPFRYRREPDSKKGAVVWSVWVDGIDQGGFDVSGSDDWGTRVAVPGTSE